MENKDTVQNNRAKTAVFDLVMTAMFSALIAVFSLISIPIGAVPVTLQTLAVCFAAGMLGLKRGIISVVIYTDSHSGMIGLNAFFCAGKRLKFAALDIEFNKCHFFVFQ